jgi:hypothetical protein
MKEERMGTCLGQVKEEFKDTKGAIRICKSKRDRQHNCEKKKDKRTNNDLQNNEKKLTRSLNFTFRYIDDVISLNNSRFGDFVDRIYTIELEKLDTTDTDTEVITLTLPKSSLG